MPQLTAVQLIYLTDDPEESKRRRNIHCMRLLAPYDFIFERERKERWDDLARYVFERTERLVAADRARHPKAKRNQPVPTTGPSGGRALP